MVWHRTESESRRTKRKKTWNVTFLLIDFIAEVFCVLFFFWSEGIRDYEISFQQLVCASGRVHVILWWTGTWTLGALPHAYCQTSPEEHVQEVLHLVRDLEAEALADHHVPRAAKLLVHRLLYHPGCTLNVSTQRMRLHKCRRTVLYSHGGVNVPKASECVLSMSHKHTPTSLLVANFSQAVTHSSIVSTLISSGMSVCCEKKNRQRGRERQTEWDTWKTEN